MRNKAFKQECEYPHSLQCDMCENLKSVLEEIEVSLKNESQTICFYSQEQQEDILYDYLQAKKHIFDWKAHILRSENQDLAKQDVLKSLDETSALISMDWAMKFQCQKYREKQSEWFGNRGLSWHVSSVVFKTRQDEPAVVTYAHLFDSLMYSRLVCCWLYRRKSPSHAQDRKSFPQQSLHKIRRGGVSPLQRADGKY